MTDVQQGPPDTNGDRAGESFVARGKASARDMLREAADYKALRKTPYGLKPIVVFTILFGVLAVDGSIVGIAFPEIVRDLDLDLPQLIGILSVIGFFLIFINLGIAWVADRTKRTPYLGIGAILSGIFSLLSAGATNVWNFSLWRSADAVSGDLLGVPAGSLIADYYPVESRGKAFALRGVLSNGVRIVAPVIVAGLVVATALEWRFAFLVTGPIVILAGIVVLFSLKEPVRGYMERRALGMAEEDALRPEEPVSFGESWRVIWSIRTMRRLFIAEIFADPGYYIYGVFFNIWLFERYGLSILERAFLLSTTIAIIGLPFGFMAGGLVDVLMRRRPQRVLILTGVLSTATAGVLALIAAGPPLWLFVVVVAAFGAAQALLGPSRGVLFAQILPAHVRTTGLNIPLLAGIPGTIARFFIIQWAFTNWGTQGALFSAVPLILLTGLIDLSAAGFYERDMRSALASQRAALDHLKAKQAGRNELLVCRDVDVEYDGVQVLFGVDLDVYEGDMIALLGTNGAGKSTLLRAISGSHEASSGAIVMDGRDITHMPPHEIAARGVVLMPGGRGIFPDLSVSECLQMANWLNDEADGRTRLDEVYELFPVLKERGDERSQLLSGGQQQMLSLAMAFLGKPKLLMIDELSLGLSPAVVQQLIDVVRRIHAQGTTVVVVEQSVNVALTVAERAVFMEKGEVKFVGETAELLRRPDILRAVYVKGTGTIGGAPASGVKGQRELRRYEIEQARAVVAAEGIVKTYGGVTAVADVSFELREGESLGLIGPNGAGKTTLFDIISGHQTPDAGRILLEGVDITEMPAEQRARLGLIRRFQDARLFPSLTVYENILVSLERRLEVRSITMTAIQLPQARQSERRARRRADALIEILELGAYRDKYVKELSTGLRRIADLACMLATEPRVLLLDEPSTGIAQAESENLAPLLRRVRHETGCSMLIIEHDIPLISKIVDELIAMDQGEVVVRGVPDVVLDDERVIASYLGTSDDVIGRSGTRTTSGKARTGRRG